MPKETTKSRESALILADALFSTDFAKTSHGLVRGPSRYRIVGILDATHAGEDAGTLLDGTRREIPFFASVAQALEALPKRPDVVIIGVATHGGVLPESLRHSVLEAAKAGLSLVNGLHRHLADDPEIARLTAEHGGTILDIRRPRPTTELRFWTGEVLALETPRIAVLGTDCALGKRTTAALLTQACRRQGLAAEMIYTGQTGWLQGFPFGFIFDCTPNDFVSGELEGAILECAQEARPDIMFIEGQASLRHPSGPAGSELILSAAAHGVILQHAPARHHFTDYEELDLKIPPLSEEVELIRLLGSEVWAIALNEEGLEDPEASRERLADQVGIPVLRPLDPKGLNDLVTVLHRHLPDLAGAT